MDNIQVTARDIYTEVTIGGGGQSIGNREQLDVKN